MLNRILIIAVALCIPLVALAYARPARVVQVFADVSCIADTICIDDSARSQEASQLYEEALAFLAETIAPLDKRPLVVFCASDECYRSFGHSNASARSVGAFCIVIGPRAWKSYYVRHEMIHRLQAQQLGVLRMYGEPEWFIEGMAYSLSQDPRPDLAQPFQSFRSTFDTWYRRVGREHLWSEAKAL